MILTYSQMLQRPTFEDRFEYLKLSQQIGEQTFGFDRYINQRFYKSDEWKSLRNFVIVRDTIRTPYGEFCCDLADPDHPIFERILVHHMNPISVDDIEHSTEFLLNPDYLVCVSHQTHNAIHYGVEQLLPRGPIERHANDTCPWRKS